jgi:hypothetical protein
MAATLLSLLLHSDAMRDHGSEVGFPFPSEGPFVPGVATLSCPGKSQE